MTGSVVEVIVPLRNEKHNIPRFIEMLRAQQLVPSRIIIADGMSTDGSRELLADLAAQDPSIVVVDNPAKIVPAALNVALQEVTSDIVARMDLHAEYAPDYLATVVGTLLENPEVTGVGSAMATAGISEWGLALASVLSHPIGLGGARHRVGGQAGPIEHVFSGCYRTEALRAIGGWDERFIANEDFEADTRLREAGGTLWLQPAARSTWYVRETPRGLALQMWRYGYYKSHTVLLHPHALKARQLAPPAVVVMLVAAVATRRPLPVAASALYLTASSALGARVASADGHSPVVGAIAPPLVHTAWRAGLIAGTLRLLMSPKAARELRRIETA